ncbi:hypothetical protein Tco_0671781 [Tanacetum coccineum]
MLFHNRYHGAGSKDRHQCWTLGNSFSGIPESRDTLTPNLTVKSIWENYKECFTRHAAINWNAKLKPSDLLTDRKKILLRNRGKAIVTLLLLTFDPEPATVTEDG